MSKNAASNLPVKSAQGGLSFVDALDNLIVNVVIFITCWTA